MGDARSNVSITGAKKFASDVDKMSDALDRNAKSMGDVGDAQGKAFSSQTEQNVKNTEKAIDRARKAQEKFGNQVLQTLEAFIRYNIVNQIFNRITRGIRDSVGAARDLEFALTKALTIAGGQITIPQLQTEVLEISGDFGIDAAEVANATYLALSNRVGTTAEALQFVDQSAEFAKAAFIDLSSAVNLTTGVMSAYGETVGATARINDELFRAIELGRVTADQLEGNLGTVIGPAADLGIQLDELLVSVDQLSLSGVPIARTMTGIRAIISSLLKPSQNLSVALEEIGAASIESAIAQRGLLGTLSAIAGTTSGLGREIARLFPNIRAFGATGPLFKTAADALDTFNDGLDGATERAAELVKATDAQQLAEISTQFKNAFLQDIGGPIIATITEIEKSFISADTAAKILAAGLTALGPPVAALVAIFATQTIARFASSLIFTTSSLAEMAIAAEALSQRLGVSVATALRLQAVFRNLVILSAGIGVGVGLAVVFEDALTPLRQTIFGMVGLVDETDKAITRARTLGKEFDAIQAAQAEIRTEKFREINRELEAGIKEARKFRREVFKTLNDINTAFVRSGNLIRSDQEITTADLKGQLGDRRTIVEGFFNDIIKASSNAERNIRQSVDAVRDLERTVSDARFDAELDRLSGDPRRQIQLIEQRIAKLVEGARKASAAGEQEESNQLLEDAVQLSSDLFGFEGQRGRALQQQNRILAAANQIQSERVKNEQAIVKEADRQRNPVRRQVADLKKLEGRLLEVRKQQQEALQLGTPEGGKAAEGFQTQIEEISGQIETLLSDVADNPLAQKLLNERELQDLTSKFFNTLAQSIEQEEVSLNVLLEADFADFRRRMEQALSDADPRGLLRRTAEITDTPIGTGDAAATIKAAQDALEASERETRLESQAAEAAEALTTSFRNLQNQLRQQRVDTSDLNFEEAKSLVLQLRALDSALAAGNIEEVQRQLTLLPSSLDDFRLSTLKALPGIRKQGEAMDDANKSLEQARNQAGNIDEIFNARSRDLINAQITAIQNFVPPSNFKVEVDGATSAVQRFTRALLENQPSQREGNERAMGSRILRSNGGIGTDTVPAMLSPGEFVMNARAARQFHSQLIAMNAGMNPTIYRQGGGDVTNNISLGDVVINQAGRNVNGREVANDIRRELRRGTTKL
jgi:TP901 family phage tail tape measure protein